MIGTWLKRRALLTLGGTPAVLSFTTVGLVESPSGVFFANIGGNYSANYGISDLSYNGDFEYTVELEANDVRGSMIGVSSGNNNVPWNHPTLFWEKMLFISSSDSLILSGVNKVVTDTAFTATYGAGNLLKLVRVSDNLKGYFNGTEVYDFGTFSGTIYVHISAFSGLYIKNPLIV